MPIETSRRTRNLEEGEIENDKEDVSNKNKTGSSRTHDEPPGKKSKLERESQISTKTGGAYIPPARLRMMQQQITDKNSEQYQRISWEALKKSINGLINKVNTSNISLIVRELFQENIVRGRGVLGQAIIQAQNASPTFTKVYSALVAIINTRFPQNGELILRRLAIQFRRSYKRNRKEMCLHSAQFIAHLMNQQVAHEIISLQVLTLLLENPTDDSVEVAVGFLKECGQKLLEVSPRGLAAVMERLRTILHEQELDKRVQYMIEVMFAIRKDGFKEHPSVEGDLDLVEESDQFTHMLQLDDDGDGKGTENELNVFHFDPEFMQNEENYKQIKKDILDESSEGSASGSNSSSEESSSEEEKEDEKTTEIEDRTETNLVALRRTIYLAIQSSLDFEECAHKLLKMEFDEKDYKEICAMIIDCCSQLRTYEKFFGLLGARFCILKKEFMEHFEVLFGEQYEAIHRLETNKLRNVAKFFAHLLHSDALPWTVLQNITLSEETTTSSSRIFIKILFQELVEYMGLPKLNQRLKDETLAPFFEGLFPKESPKSTRFAINFFTSIGLGGITDELREHLKITALQMSEKMRADQIESLNIDSASSSDESSDSSSSSEEKSKKKKKKKKKKKSKKSSQKEKESSINEKASSLKGRDSSQRDQDRESSRKEKESSKNERAFSLKGRDSSRRDQDRDSSRSEKDPSQNPSRRDQDRMSSRSEKDSSQRENQSSGKEKESSKNEGASSRRGRDSSRRDQDRMSSRSEKDSSQRENQSSGKEKESSKNERAPSRKGRDSSRRDGDRESSRSEKDLSHDLSRRDQDRESSRSEKDSSQNSSRRDRDRESSRSAKDSSRKEKQSSREEKDHRAEAYSRKEKEGSNDSPHKVKKKKSKENRRS